MIAVASAAANVVGVDSSVTPVSSASLGSRMVMSARSVGVIPWERLTTSVMPRASVCVGRGWRGRSVTGARWDTSI